MVSRGSLPWRRGGFFSLHRLGRFRFKKSAFPLPLLCFPSSDSYTEMRNFAIRRFSLPDNARTLPGHLPANFGVFSPVFGLFRFAILDNGNCFPEAEPRSGRIPPPYPLRKIRRESNRKNALWCSSSLPRAVFTRAPIWGTTGQVLRDLPAPPRTFEGGSLPGRIFPAPEWFALLPVQLSPFAGSSYSLEAYAISSVLCWMNANEFAIRTPRYSRYRPYLVGL